MRQLLGVETSVSSHVVHYLACTSLQLPSGCTAAGMDGSAVIAVRSRQHAWLSCCLLLLQMGATPLD